jgi:HEXXH motif-containing protein
LTEILELSYGNYKIFNKIYSYENWDSNFIKALEIIRSVNLQLLYKINPLVYNILVIESQDESHGSMSPKSLTGTIFLPDVEDSTLIAECFVHECLHQYLYRFEHVSSFFENKDGLDELYYKPWEGKFENDAITGLPKWPFPTKD